MQPDMILLGKADAFEEGDSFALALGILALAFGIWQLCRETAPKRWLRVPGKILTSKIDEKLLSSGFARARKVYMPAIEYEYSHDQKSFKSSHWRIFNYSGGTTWHANQVISRFPPGKEVPVLIDPKRPERSVLEYGMTPMSWIPIGMGFVLVLTACLTKG
jgi:Protein of unknown function (DUF3592)